MKKDTEILSQKIVEFEMADEQLQNKVKLLEAKKEKLTRLLLLSDPSVSSVEMNEVSARQWTEYCTVFPDEQ